MPDQAAGSRSGDGLVERTARRAAEAVTGGFLNGSEISLTRDAGGVLWLRQPGESEPIQVTSVRPAFPLSMGPDMLVFYGKPSTSDPESGQHHDHGRSVGEELGILRSLHELPTEMQDLVAEEVEKAYFVPRVLRILSIEEEFGIQEWQVTTDRGPRTFEVTERSGIRPFDNYRIVIKDVDGNRYQIADARLLDRRSQQWLDLQL